MTKRRTKVESLISEVYDWPACSALLSKQTRKFWHGRSRPGNPDGTDHCGNAASYKIGGKHYCGRHAAYVALRLAVEAGGIQKVTDQ